MNNTNITIARNVIYINTVEGTYVPHVAECDSRNKGRTFASKHGQEAHGLPSFLGCVRPGFSPKSGKRSGYTAGWCIFGANGEKDVVDLGRFSNKKKALTALVEAHLARAAVKADEVDDTASRYLALAGC